MQSRKYLTSVWKTRRKASPMGWQHSALTLIGVVFAFTPISSMAEDFSYELKAIGTESSDVTFNVNLTATGKETVVRQEVYNDEFPDLFADTSLKKKCRDSTRTICLPDNCEIDSTQGDGSGYGTLVENELGVSERNHTFDPESKCLTSYIKVCSKSRWRANGKYYADHVVYGKCTYTESWTQTQEKGPFSLNESDGFIKLAEYDGPIGSPEGEPDTANVDYYEVSLVTDTPDEATSIQLGMFDGDPANNKNGKEVWAKTNYQSPWLSSKQGTAPIPTDGVIVIDSISETAPNNDTTYEVLITVPPNTYTQNEQGIVDAVDLFGWLNSDQEFLVTADKKFLPPLAVIDNISPNPAPVETPVSFEGHGEHNDEPDSTTITNAIWQTNRSDEALHTCSESPCNFDADDLVSGQHLIRFSVEAEDTTKSPEATEVLTINQAPIVSILFTESTGEKDGTVKVVKWKDDEFDPFHDPITFVGQAVDLDGIITEYEWKSDKDDVVGNELSFSHNNLSLGKHKITFRAKDDSNEWSNEVTKIVEVIKPPILMVHGWQPFDLFDGAESWKWDEEELLEKGYSIHKMQIKPGNERFSYGAKRISEEIEKLTEEYGIPKVNIVAHSMGGLNSRWYMQTPGYRDDVNKLVMAGTPNHGSTWAAALKPSVSKSHAFAAMLDLVALGAGMGSGFLGFTGPKLPLPVKKWDLLKGEINPIDPVGGAVKGAIGGAIGAVVIGIIGETFGGPAISELVPQSSALRFLNGNKKDEGYRKDEPADNTQTVYGKKAPYFNIYGSGFVTISHKHIIIPLVEWDIVLPKLSSSGDFIVHKKSAMLDDIPYTKESGAIHALLKGSLTDNDNVREQALYYLGDDPDDVLEEADGDENSATALAGHAISANVGEISVGDTQEQQFEVDAEIQNLRIMLMGLSSQETKFTLQLASVGCISEASCTKQPDDCSKRRVHKRSVMHQTPKNM